MVGIRDDILSEQLQIDPELTIDKAKWGVTKKTQYNTNKVGILRGNTDTHVASDPKEAKQTKSKQPCSTKYHKNASIWPFKEMHTM